MVTKITKITKVERVCDRCGGQDSYTVDDADMSYKVLAVGDISTWECSNWGKLSKMASPGNPLGGPEVELCAYCMASFDNWLTQHD